MAKKKLLTGLSVLVFLLAVAVIVLAVTNRGYAGESFALDGEGWSAEVTGDEMTLDLPSNPSTGYSWVVTEKTKVFATDSNQFIAETGEEVRAGDGGITQFHIAALKEGVGTMTLQYKQDWEGGEVDGTDDLTLTVSRHHKKYLQIDSVKFEKAE
jgi:predicted secreted protein